MYNRIREFSLQAVAFALGTVLCVYWTAPNVSNTNERSQQNRSHSIELVLNDDVSENDGILDVPTRSQRASEFMLD